MKISQHVETTDVLEFVKAALPAGTKQLRIVLGIPVSRTRIRKKISAPKKPKTFKTPKTSVTAEGFAMLATPNGLKPVGAPRTLSLDNTKVRVS